jgi:hypothetical protein
MIAGPTGQHVIFAVAPMLRQADTHKVLRWSWERQGKTRACGPKNGSRGHYVDTTSDLRGEMRRNPLCLRAWGNGY